jgi:hypothetical protein
MDDQVKVKEANARFYEAVSSQSLTEMEAVWSHASWVKCVHPGWELLTGWDKIRESWDNIFHNAGYLRITISNLSIQSKTNLPGLFALKLLPVPMRLIIKRHGASDEHLP